ncbi:MAG: cysteine synthase A [Defluviitaleaceae bacterium]|nr:cysteine synthase A [Defluviitaleaceae bacterium]
MDKLFGNLEEMIGNTPLFAIKNFAKQKGASAAIFGKLESKNPAGSVKDRLALALILDGEKRGVVNNNAVIIEATSGNTGIGLAALAASRGYRCILTMPETMTMERRKLLSLFGAEIVLTPGKDGMKGSIAKAKELEASIPGGVILGQFDNPANPAFHYATTGPEIWEQTDGKIDIFVSGAGTGGTITGAGKFLREQNPDIYIAVVEAASSPVLSGGSPAPHKIQGISPGFVPAVLDTTIYNEIIQVKDDDALEISRELAKTDGLLCGTSSGAAVWAALQLALRKENAGKNIVAIIPDTGERYLSTYETSD